MQQSRVARGGEEFAQRTVSHGRAELTKRRSVPSLMRLSGSSLMVDAWIYATRNTPTM